MCTIDSIKHLDKEYINPQGQTLTLRMFMMKQTFPLAPKKNTKTKALIHSIDWTSTGMDAGTRVIITSYKDRSGLVEKLSQILPEYVEYVIDESAKKAWFHHQTMPQDVEFHTDMEGNWTGAWFTEDDRMNENILQEEMEFDVIFENMDLVANRRVLDSEDASLVTFQCPDGRSTQSSKNTMNATEDASIAAASTASGGSGITR